MDTSGQNQAQGGWTSASAGWGEWKERTVQQQAANKTLGRLVGPLAANGIVHLRSWGYLQR